MHSRVAPPGARLPLVVLVVALAAGAGLFLRLHRAPPRTVRGPAAASAPAAGTSARTRH